MNVSDRLETRFEMSGLRSLTSGLSQAGNAFAILAGVAIGAQATAGLIRAQVAAEQLSNEMLFLMGSTDKANSALAYLEQLADSTHQRVTDLQSAFVALASHGLQPTDDLMKDLIRYTNATGEGLKQTAEKLGNAYENGRNFGRVLQEIRERGEDAALNVGGMTSAVNDLENSWHRFIDTAAGSPLLIGVVNLLRHALSYFDFLITRIQTGLVGIIGLFGLLGELLVHGPKGFIQGLANWAGLMAWFVQQQHVFDGSGKIGMLAHPGAPASGAGAAGGGVLRQIIGGGQIAQIGVKPSELPGLSPLSRPGSVTVKLEPNKSLEQIVNETLEKLMRHGIIHPGIGPAGA